MAQSEGTCVELGARVDDEKDGAAPRSDPMLRVGVTYV